VKGLTEMDKFQQLAWEAHDVCVCVLGNPETLELHFVDLAREKASDERIQQLREHNLQFLGVLGVVAGTPRCAFALPFDDVTVEYIAAKFALFVDGRSKGDSVEWLTRLYQLRDNRSEVN
jgi:hypothetical protein